jgi:integrase/recombinase XerD
MAEMSPLRRRMIEDMTIRNLSPATQRSYVHAVSKFSRYFGHSPDRLGLEDVRAYQVHLISKGISWASLNQVVCALRFFYGVTLGCDAIPERIAYAREPRKLPAVLSADEVVRFLEAVSSLKARVALTTAYAAGLRVSEVVGLKAADIDSDRMVIRVECGKSGKERYVMLSEQLLGILCSYWRLAHPERFLFPGRDKHRPIEPTVLHAACRSARVAASIDKRVSVHVLRHSFPAFGSPDTPMTPCFIARADVRRNTCLIASGSGSRPAISNFIRARHGSCIARTSIGPRRIPTSSSPFSATRSVPARRWTSTAAFM